ncbi:MAG: LPS export ABC transporter permease LptG [Trichlorobacter sp.]
MGIISRYIAGAWLRMLLLCQAGFLAVYLILDFMEKFGRFMRAGASFWIIVQFFLFKIPEMVVQSMPFAVLMATLLTLGMFSRSSELTALRSCGLSIPRIVTPLLWLGLVCSLLLLLNAEFLVPHSYKRMEYVDKVLIKKKDRTAVFRLNNIWFRSNNLVLQAKFFDPQAVVLKGVTVWEVTRSMEPARRMDAERAVYGKNGWHLEKVRIRSFVSGTVPLQQVELQAIPLSLKVEDLRLLDNKADSLSFRELSDYAHSLQSGGYSASRYLTMMHAKLALPFGAFVMVVLGIPFALKTGRTAGVAKGVAIGVSLGFAYFIINTAVQSYGRSGVLPPLVAAWGANLIFVLSGIWLAMTVKQQ